MVLQKNEKSAYGLNRLNQGLSDSLVSLFCEIVSIFKTSFEMGRITIAIYRPKKGHEEALAKLVESHMAILSKEGLVTARKPIVMKAEDQSIVEIFEWQSSQAIQQAHENPEVGKLWNAFNEVCDYVPPVDVKEFHNLFAEFEAVN
jgi:hypothetical protein